MQLPEDDSVPAEEVRKEIVSRLSKDTPWQTVSEYPELQVDLTSLEIPSITRFIPERSTTETESGVVKSSTQKFDLRNEAVDRGLRFFGRTSERLDQPGIMLFETLGCGGGTLDYDLDGWSDLYLAAAGGTPPQRDSEPNALFRNQAGTFHLLVSSRTLRIGDLLKGSPSEISMRMVSPIFWFLIMALTLCW